MHQLIEVAKSSGLPGSTTFEVASKFASFDVMALPVQYASSLKEAPSHSNLHILTLPSLEASRNEIYLQRIPINGLTH